MLFSAPNVYEIDLFGIDIPSEVSSPFEGLSDIGSPGSFLGTLARWYCPDLDCYLQQEDEVFPAEEQPLPAAASPTAQSPDYVPESDPEEDPEDVPEEDDDEDPKEDPVDYPADGGDDGDDEDESLEDDDVDIEAIDDEEDEEHPAPADSTVVALTTAVYRAPSTEEKEP
ncbi:hypothetical protein Tco_0525515 [Tanacetum coccineum]